MSGGFYSSRMFRVIHFNPSNVFFIAIIHHRNVSLFAKIWRARYFREEMRISRLESLYEQIEYYNIS